MKGVAWQAGCGALELRVRGEALSIGLYYKGSSLLNALEAIYSKNITLRITDVDHVEYLSMELVVYISM